MPLKNGRLTPMERTFAEAYAATGDQGYARWKSGMSNASGNASRALARPGVQAEIVRQQRALMFEKLLPLAVHRLASILANDKLKASDHNQAIKTTFAHTIGALDAGVDKQDFDLDAGELARAAHGALLNLARRDAETVEPVEPDIFS